MDIIGNVYKSFLKAGFSPKQAKALTAEVGRENNFNSKYVYGSHQDAANNKTNVGFFSWQGERGKELVNNLKNKGLYKNNRIVESQEALDEMAKYTMYEIQNKGAYKKTKERFLSNPDISQNDAAEVLGRDFIRWDMDGKHINNVADHKRRRDNFYNKLNTNQYKTTEIKAFKEAQEQTPYINPIDFNTPEYSGMTFSEEEAPQVEQTPQQASQDLLEESFLEEADAMLTQTQPIQEYEPAPQYNVELNPIEYQPIAQFQKGGKFAELDAKMAKTRSQLNKGKTPQLSSRERPKEVVRENISIPNLSTTKQIKEDTLTTKGNAKYNSSENLVVKNDEGVYIPYKSGVSQAELTQDNRNQIQKNISKNYSSKIRNEELSAFDRPLTYLANPEKILGDLGVNGVNTSEEDRIKINTNRYNPNISNTERFTNHLKLGLGYLPEATLNTALAVAGTPMTNMTGMSTRQVIKEGAKDLGKVAFEAYNPIPVGDVRFEDIKRGFHNTPNIISLTERSPLMGDVSRFSIPANIKNVNALDDANGLQNTNYTNNLSDNVKRDGGELEVKESDIQGKGIFTKDFFKKGDLIGLTHTNSQPSTELGKFHNHSENPNTESFLIGNKRFLFAKKDINKDKEITVDYKKQPELEQPNNFK